MTSVKFSDISDAFMFVSSGYSAEAYVSRKTGEFFLTGDEAVFDFGENPLPDDLDDPTKYIPIPDKRDLDLGTRLVIKFTQRHAPECYDDVREIFRKKGAYGRFKGLLEHHGKLEHWYTFSDEAEQRALLQWCEDNGLEVENDEPA